MPLLLHPHVVDVLNAVDDLLEGHDHWDAFESALAQMEETHSWQHQRYCHFREGQKRTSAVEELRAPVEEAWALRGQVLGQLALGLENRDLEPLAELARQLQKASQRISKGSEDLEIEDTRQRLSSLPLLHDFLQAGFNVYGEYEPYAVLEKRLGPLVAWIQALAEDWAGECELFPALAERHASFEEALTLFKNGVGAIVVYQDSNEPSDLLAGLTQIQIGGQQLADFVSSARKDGADLSTHSDFREIERLAVRACKLSPQDPLVEEAKQGVLNLIDRQRTHLQDLADIPFHSEDFSEALADVEGAIEHEEQALAAADLEALGEASARFQAGLEGLGTLLEEASADLEEAPALQELRRAVLGVYYGQVPRRFLKDLLVHIGPGFAQALSQEEEEDARLALETCLQALECAEVGLTEGSAESLIDAWSLLNRGGEALIVVQKRRTLQAEAEEESRKVTCTQCGVRQQASAACSGCGARLIKAYTGVESSSLQVAEGDAEETQPDSLRQLFELIGQIREGVADSATVHAVVDPVMARARIVLTQASQGGAKEEFLRSVERFSEGLQGLADQAQERDLEGLEACAAVLEETSQSLLAYTSAPSP